MTRIFALFVCVFFCSFSSFADALHSSCPLGLPDDQSGFCSSFRTIAECHCVESGLPKGMCQDMNALYNRMISIFGSVQKACEYQHDTATQICIDDWACFRQGGKDSLGRLCSSTGRSC
ncbi:MAG: hypothetical protein A3F11_10985 [Gammaproteobacteria bacterium RIFCSPHIGHO2_12_FULL_37_14]|nr:MAG: hypothetical protein A3F11_10985 [Gammaproteobacteria bacterium RIFCSPHIGHO2_12_FULL_37_14]